MSMQTYSILALIIGFLSIGFTLWLGVYIAKKKYIESTNS